MKFTCLQSDLSKALTIVSKAVTSRTTIPILKGILLEVSTDGYLKMSASDLDITIENKISVEKTEPGSIVIGSKLFGDIIRKLPNADVTVSTENDNVTISCVNTNFSLVGISSDEFPNINNEEEIIKSITLKSETIKDMIRKTSFAASVDEAKGVVTGILIEVSDNEINMVAIDGYRMAITREEMISMDDAKVIISAKLMNEISKILSEVTGSEDIELVLSSKKAIFKIGDVKTVVRLLDGEFIKYRDILPKDSRISVKINKNDLHQSIERASLLSKEGKNNLIRMNITDNVMTISSKSEEGNLTEDVLISKEGENLEIGFNAKYVIDVLKAIDDEEIQMLFNSGITPCLVEPIEGNKFEYLILPVRISGN